MLVVDVLTGVSIVDKYKYANFNTHFRRESN
jgi:hypothetical protein